MLITSLLHNPTTFRVVLAALCIMATPSRAQIEVRYRGTLVGDSSATRLAQPLGMSLDHAGNIYIADTGHHRVLKCDVQGKLVREVGGFGFGPQQFDRPVDVWVDNGLNVFVADYNNRRLQRYDKDLNFISTYANDEALEESLHFGYPAALALSAQGELFVADHEFNRVLRFEALGNPKASFGDFNWGEGGLERPAKIFITRKGEVWVSDSLRHAILIYDAFGNFVRGIALAENAAPCGMAEWGRDVIVVDRKQHRLLFMSAQGERLLEFGKRGKDEDAFDAPAAVAVLRNDGENTARVLVLDSGNNRVQEFEARAIQ